MVSALDRKLRMTWFASQAGQQKSDLEISLNRLAEMIGETSAPEKRLLPWIKPAAFGKLRTPLRPTKDGGRTGNSLRHDANVEASTGVAADYDGGVIRMDEAVTTAEKYGLVALFYESPSSTPEAPRWRGIFPYQHEYEDPEDHRRFCENLNGIYEGVLDQGFFDLSRAFYYGSIDGKTPVSIMRTSGTRYLDGDHGDLDLMALPKQGRSPTSTGAESEQDTDIVDIDWADFVTAVMAIPNGGAENPAAEDRDYWIRMGAAIHHQSEGDEDGRELFHAWSALWSGGDNDEATEAAWESFREDRHYGRVITGRWVLGEARKFGFRNQISAEDAFEDISQDNEPDIEPDTDEGEFDEKSPFAALLEAAGVDIEPDTEEDDDPLGNGDGGDDDDGPKKRKVIEEYNAKYAVVDMNGKCRVMTLWNGGETFSTRRDFEDIHANDMITFVTEDDKEKVVPAPKYWWTHKGRRTYLEGLAFEPGIETEPARYNLWRGFKVEPDPIASCDRFLEHLYSNVCRGDDEQYAYATNWLAHMVQHPGKKPDVALVLGGLKGVGKDTIGNYVGRMLFRKNYIVVKNKKHLTGNFNALQAEAVLLHAEDAFWVGDKESIGTLNGLITSETAIIERKGIDAVMVPSCLRLIISSNSECIVPATADERRYSVYEVGDAQKGNNSYFDALYHERNHGGPAALFHFLQQIDLTTFQPRDVPNTVGLGKQKKGNLRGIDLFVFEMLDEGVLPEMARADGFADSRDWSNGPVYVNKAAFYDAFVQWWKDHRYQDELPAKAVIGRALAHHIREIDGNAKTPRVNGQQQRAYLFPSLPRCRDLFEEALRSPVEWSEDDGAVV